MRFLIDAQLPPHLARWLISQGHDAEHVFNIEKLSSDDRLIWEYAINSCAVIVTKDKDFVRYRQQATGPQILFVGLANVSKQQLLNQFEKSWPTLALRLGAGQAIVELL